MRIILSCPVSQNFTQVFDQFDRELFVALAPPLLPMGLKRFDGCKVGDEVHIQTPGGLWISVITEAARGESEHYFVDEGSKLPPPLVYWRHKHIVRQDSLGSSVIIDDIEFRARWSVLDPVIKPFLWMLFKLRHPVYRRYFQEK
jgi:ligand-binding SRPBCC domain-containing protein